MMKVSGLKKTTVLMLGVILLLSAIVGCDPVEPSGDPSLTAGESNAATVGTQATTASRSLPRGEITTEATAFCFCAEIYIQSSAMSSWFSLNFRIEEDKIYIQDNLYEKIPVGERPAILYHENLLYDAVVYDRENGNQEISDTMQRIKDSEPHCVLKCNDSPSPVVVYKFNDLYFFVTFYEFNGNLYVHRIHYAILDGEVFP